MNRSSLSKGSGTKFILKAAVFGVAVLVLIDFFMPQSTLGMSLGALFLLLVGAGSLFARQSRFIVGLQSTVVVATVSLAVAVVGVETLFRVLLLRPAIPVSDQEFSRHISSYWPEPVEVERAAEKIRIVGLADSFGRAGEDGNFYYVAGDQLSVDGHPNEMVNLSEWGLELRDELELFQRFGKQYQPDLVVHSFFVGNDFDLPTQELSFFGTVPMRYTPGLRPIRPRWFLHRRWLENCLQARRDQKEAEIGGFSDAGFLAIEKKRLDKWSSHDHLDSVWPRVRGYLDQIRSEVEDGGAIYSIVIQPDQYQVDRALRDRMTETYGIDERAVEMELPQTYLRRYCESVGIACLDLLPVLAESAATGDLYLANDTHYNLEGNSVVGQEVMRFVSRTIVDRDPESE